MRFKLVDIEHLPKTHITDGTALYLHPLKLVRRYFLQRIKLCLSLLNLKEGNVIDIGCGSGILLPTLTQINGLVVGIDIHKHLPAVKSYLKKNNFQNISLVQADSHILPFRNGVFSSILMISLLDHLQKPRVAINEMYQIAAINSPVIFGFHISNRFSIFTMFIWTALHIISQLLILRNFKEIILNFFKPENWQHSYSDSVLIQWISKKLQIKRRINLHAISPVYVAIKSVKKNYK